MSGEQSVPIIVTTSDADEIVQATTASPPEEGAASKQDGVSATQSNRHGRSESLQIPETSFDRQAAPSSPTLSTTSNLSNTGYDLMRTSTALRDNDPSKELGHARNLSGGSVSTDAHHEIVKSDKLTLSEKDNEITGKSTSGGDLEEAKGSSSTAKSPSAWSRYKAKLRSFTRQGRKDAQAAELAAEQERLDNIDPTPFPFRPTALAELVDPKSVKKLREMGGVRGIIAGLGTDDSRGLDADQRHVTAGETSSDEESQSGSSDPEPKRPKGWVTATPQDRNRVFGENILPAKKGKSLLLLMWLALQDKILILLCVAAVISLALGLYSDFGAPPQYIPCENPEPGLTGCRLPQVDWVEGVAILIAVLIVDLVGSLNDWQKERQFKKLNAKKEERDVKVIRSGAPSLISVHSIQVGDLLQLEPGEIIPCDGIFIRGHNVRCDESGATGESDMIRKVPYEDCLQDIERSEKEGSKAPNRDCFLISGSRCLEGVGEYIVIAVGPVSFNGKLLMSLRTDTEMTPLQAKLNRLAEIIAYAGTAAGVILFSALMIRFFVQLARPLDGIPRTSNQKAQNFIDILISAVVIIVVAVPEGLPLATTLALAFATKRMTKENLLVRMLSACETSASSNVICTDKTGTLTQNEMTVVAGTVGVHLKFARDVEQNHGRIETTNDEGKEDWAVDLNQLNSVIDGPLRRLFNDAITVNSTAFEESDAKDEALKDNVGTSRLSQLLHRLPLKRSKKEVKSHSPSNLFVGSKTETALLSMAKDLQWEDYRTARSRAEVVTSYPFSSERKAMAVVVKTDDGKYRLYVKGASEILTRICSHHIDVTRTPTTSGEVIVKPFSAESRENVAKTIIFYANQTLRTIALCYRDFESWPPKEAAVDEEGLVIYESLASQLTLIAITGIEDPLRPGVTNAVATCGKAGVQVKMCTGDNVLTARSIATQCGIFTPGGLIMEGPIFRKLDEADKMMVVPRLQVLARCSPNDKKVLVECLQKMDNVVAVTGDGTNDAPALKTADIGFSMGIAGTEVAREASDIILMDDNFQSIVTAIMWGRSVSDAVKRFLQFQLSVNVGAVGITFISAVSSEDETAVFTAVQLLWCNCCMDALAALALASDPASPHLLDRKPTRRRDPLITTDMWKQIVGQAIYQFAVTLTLYFAGKSILGMNATDPVGAIREDRLLRALIFNLFMWCQLFNQVNCRSLTREKNIFKGLQKNFWFMGIALVEVAIQVMIMFVGGAAFSVVPLGGREWGISIIAGSLSWPLGYLIRLVPTQPIENVLIRLGLMNDPDVIPLHHLTDDPKASAEKVKEAWEEPAIGDLADKLSAFALIRGGRSRAAFLGKTRNRRMKNAKVHPGGLMALVPALIAGGIGGDWRPTNPVEASRDNPAAGDPSMSSWQLYQGDKIQMHPETEDREQFLATLQGKAGDKGVEGRP